MQTEWNATRARKKFSIPIIYAMRMRAGIGHCQIKGTGSAIESVLLFVCSAQEFITIPFNIILICVAIFWSSIVFACLCVYACHNCRRVFSVTICCCLLCVALAFLHNAQCALKHCEYLSVCTWKLNMNSVSWCLFMNA